MTTNQPNTPAAPKAAPTNKTARKSAAKAPRKPARRAPTQPRSQAEAWELVGLARHHIERWCNKAGKGFTTDERSQLLAEVYPYAMAAARRYRPSEPVTPELVKAFGRDFKDVCSQRRKLARSIRAERLGLSRTEYEARGDTIVAVEAGADPVEAAALAHQRRAHTPKPSQQAVRIVRTLDGRRPFVSLDAVMADSHEAPTTTGHEDAVAKLQAERRALDAEAALKRLGKAHPELRRLLTALKRGGSARAAALAQIASPTPELASLLAQVRAVIANEYHHLMAW